MKQKGVIHVAPFLVVRKVVERSMNHPDDTRDKIIAVAGELFLTKGYEDTRISDIIEGLDGMTKGAIYHYFDSKEDIFNAFVDQLGKSNIALYDHTKADPHLTGTEKLTEIVRSSFDNQTMSTITEMSPCLLESPRLLSAYMKEMLEVAIPDYLVPIIEEGITDGSIKAEYPEELAALIAVALNVWLSPLIFNNERDSSGNKMHLLNQILEPFGIKLFEEALIDQLEQ
ncbi:MAG: TetR/AcrR family transcriptional regulator [Aerococcus sp.]|nr:TetR/AcrR family transcriptional regulator [Aerococcus sp.]